MDDDHFVGWPTPEMAARGDWYNLILGFAIAVPSGMVRAIVLFS